MLFSLFLNLGETSILQAQQGHREEADKKAESTKDEPARKTTGQNSDEVSKTDKKPVPEESMDDLLQKELEETTTRKPQTDETRPSWGWQFLKTFFTLAILLFVFWAMWKIYFFKKNLPARTSQVLKILYEHDISSNKKLQIIEIGNRLMVLGISDSSIQLITEISDKDSVAEIKLNCEKENQTEKVDFFLVLTNTIKDKISGWITPSKKHGSKHDFGY